MDYELIYSALVKKRKENVPSGYSENHHILPKCLGGSDSEDNKVLLTGREHYVAHLLLAKIHKGTPRFYPMINAVWMMQMRCEERGIPKIKSSRMYEWVRYEHSKQVSKQKKIGSKGKNNSQYGTIWICNLELQKNKKIKKDEDIPDGWVKGRNKWNCVSKQSLSKEETYTKISKSLKGRKLTDETKAKMRESAIKRHKQNPLSESSRKKLSISLTGRNVSDKTKERQKDSAIKRWKNRARLV